MFCPFLSILKEMKGAHNRDTNEEQCKGSACAMWRQDQSGNGYCGLAGKPNSNQTEWVLKPRER